MLDFCLKKNKKIRLQSRLDLVLLQLVAEVWEEMLDLEVKLTAVVLIDLLCKINLKKRRGVDGLSSLQLKKEGLEVILIKEIKLDLGLKNLQETSVAAVDLTRKRKCQSIACQKKSNKKIGIILSKPFEPTMP